MNIDIDVSIERMERPIDEFLRRWGHRGGMVQQMDGGKELVSAAKRLLKAATKLREVDSTLAKKDPHRELSLPTQFFKY